MMKIAFIGIGVMGRSMVINLLKAGYPVSVYSRREESAREAVEKGAVWQRSIADCVREADMVITMVGYPKDVEEVYFKEGGIIESAPAGAILADMTTTSPKLAVRIFEAAGARGLSALDAPVSGGDIGARNGTLAIMAGGEEDVFRRALPVFECMGKTIRYQGKAGSGQHTKMANQIAIAGTAAGVAEALSYAKAAGLDPAATLDAISGGSAVSWQMLNNGPKMLKRDFAPGFFIKHFIKDMSLAREEAEDRELSLPVLTQVLELYPGFPLRYHYDSGLTPNAENKDACFTVTSLYIGAFPG